MNNNLGQTEIHGDNIVIVGGECDARTITKQTYGHYPQLALHGELAVVDTASSEEYV